MGKQRKKMANFMKNEFECLTILAKDNNPNVIRLLDRLQDTKDIYYVYEYCNGGDLQTHFKKKKVLSEAETLQIFWQLLNAMRSLAAHGVIHRDVKPENCMFHDG